MNPSLLVSSFLSALDKGGHMYITGNESIGLNILAWLCLWTAVSFGTVFVYIVIVEFFRWFDKQKEIRANKRYMRQIEVYRNDFS